MLELTPERYKAHLAQKLALLPDSPGVYLHKDAQGKIIYVGKAVSLKNRVRQYFQSSRNHGPKVQAMVRHIADFSYILVDSETEALTLECNLIKQYRPRYNILLKDDKGFPYVRIDRKNPFPRAEIVYRLRQDGARYFGPYLSRYAVREAMDAIRDNFPLRTCKKDLKKAIARGERPCLNYHIGKCLAPCSGKVSEEEYRKIVDQVAAFLNGRTDEILAGLKEEMKQAAEELAYERAAMLRDRISAIETISEKQKAITTGEQERDIFAVARLEGETVVFGLFMRSGKVVGAEHYAMNALDDAPEEVMASFLGQFYNEAYVPREIVVREGPEELGALEDWLSQKRGTKVNLHVPVRGDKKKLADMAWRNGMDYLEKTAATRQREWERTEGALRDLASALGMEELPRRMECYDISHTMGMEPVASMVVFEGGKAASKQYRRFRVRQSGNDDYAAMKEVLTRRLERMLQEQQEGKEEGFAARPDLLVIDGGKGQLNVCLEVLGELGLSDFPAIGLAERLEEVFLPGQSAPVLLERGSPALHLLQRIRDEAHRFAITYHRSLRNKASMASVLEEIKGVGPVKRRALLEAFPSPEAIRQAEEEELRAAQGIDKRTAALVYAYFHPEEGGHEEKTEPDGKPEQTQRETSAGKGAKQ